ncbi:DNA polymerase III [Neisseria animaloris]|uniref:DNA polymerase III n=1 Tax=Neisseria animaloris TaxID=326522 RepID=UPI000D2F5679|nr:DNA polymerase III [Neisseria animaloris]
MDFILYDYKMLLERSSDNGYREDINKAAISLMKFLVDNELLVGVIPFNEDGSIKEDLVIHKSNVTEEGFQLFLKPVNNWWNALDRGTSPEKITILENGLKKIRTNNKA